MGLNKKTMVEVMLFLVMALTAATVEAGRGFDPTTLLSQAALMNVKPNLITKSATTACCDRCICTKSEPPQCQCRDTGETCHSACKLCVCTFSYPPQCHCLDTTTFCYDKCSSSDDSAKTAN